MIIVSRKFTIYDYIEFMIYRDNIASKIEYCLHGDFTNDVPNYEYSKLS